MERVYTTPRIDKLGVKPGARVAVIGLPADDPVIDELRSRTHDVTVVEAPDDGTPAPATDIVLLAADDHAALSLLPQLRERLVPNGGIWVVSRKGKAATLRDVEVIAAAIAADLVDNKGASFDETRTSLRLVIPLAMRPKR